MNTLASMRLTTTIEKRGWFAFLVAFATACMVALFAQTSAAWATNGTWEGSGTEDDPYLIADAADLQELSAQVMEQGGSSSKYVYAGEYFKLANDIDASDVEWSPIGNYANYSYYIFSGNFDGDGHSVTLNASASTGCLGLFGYVKGSSTSNPASIKNVIVKGAIKNTNTSAYTGGVAGYVYNTVVEGCGNEADIEAAAPNLGGIAGYCASASLVEIKSCYNTGDVTYTGTASYSVYTGGILGYMGYPPSALIDEVSDCYNTGEITGRIYTGGIAGYIYANASSMYGGVLVKNCYNAGSVVAADAAAATATAGLVNAKGMNAAVCPDFTTIQNSYNLESACSTVLTGEDYVSILDSSQEALSVEDMKKTATDMSSAAFVKLLGDGFEKGQAYPVLAWQLPDGVPVIVESPENAAYVKGAVDVDELSVTVDSDSEYGELVYQWYKASKEDLSDAEAIEGATSAAYKPSVDEIGVAYYYCAVRNDVKVGTDYYYATSQAARVVTWTGTAATAPVIETQPAAESSFYQGIAEGAELSLSVKAPEDGGTLTYQWYQMLGDTPNSESDLMVKGATERTFVPSVDELGKKAYYCVVTNTTELVSEASTTSAIAYVCVEELKISSADELAAFAAAVNGGLTYEGSTVVLVEDIDLSSLSEGKTLTCIGESTTSGKFMGVFDGMNHTISNLNIVGTKDNVGLFGCVEGTEEQRAVIRNLTVSGSVTSQGRQDQGGVVGYAKYADIENVSFSGSVSSTYNYVGGIVGYAQDVEVRNCSAQGSVSSTYYYVGGLVGYAAGQTTITNSFNVADVSGYNYVGGVVGYAGSSATLQLENVYSAGSVAAKSTSIGGVVGKVTSITAKNCYYDSTVADGIGPVGGASEMDGIAGVTTDELRLLAPTLGEAFAKDAHYINGGYPIFADQFEVLDISDYEFSIENESYSGQAFNPTSTLKPVDGHAADNTDYVIQYYADEACTEPLAASDVVNAGKYWALAEGVESAGFSGKTAVTSFEIEKAVLTASYASETITWDEEPQLAVEVTGFVNGETAGTAAGYVAPAVSAPETLVFDESYELTPAGGEADNYEFEYVSGTLSVIKISVAIPVAVEGLVYDGTEQVGVAAGQGFSVEAGSASAAGDYAAKAILAEGYCWLDDSVDAIDISWSIAKRAAVVEVNDASKTFGDDDPALTATVSGVVEGDELVYELSREPGEDVDEYAVKVTLGNNPNYDVSVADGTFTINRKAIAVPSAAEGLIYSGSEQTGVAPGEGYAVEVGSAIHAGNYTATATPDANHSWASLEGEESLTAVEISWSIAKATLTASYAGEAVAWGEEPALAVSVTGFVGEEDASTASGYVAPVVSLPEATEPGKSYELAPSGGEADNYEFEYVSGTLSVAKIPVEAPTAIEGLVYDGTEQTGVAAGEGYVLFGTLSASDAGYQVAVALPASGYCWTDGSVSPVGILWSIAQRPVTIEVANASKTIGDADPAFTATVSGAVEGEEIAYSLLREAGEAAGEYTIKATPGDNPNYDVSVINGTLTINRKAVAAPTAAEGLTYTGLEQVAVSASDGFTIEGGSAVHAGSYAAKAVLAEGYCWSDGSLDAIEIPWSITKATLTASYAGEAVAWGEGPVFAVEVTGFVNGEGPATASGYVAPAVLAPASLEPGASYNLAPAGGAADDYVFEYASGTLTVGEIPYVATDEFSDVGTAENPHWVVSEGWLEQVVALGLMGGYTDASGNPTGLFGPDDVITRAQVATVLYRHANPGSDATTNPAAYEANATPFVDCASGAYYTAAINWAYEAGILTGDKAADGSLAGTVRPDAGISRQELATMLYRYAALCGADVSFDPAVLASAPDASAVQAFAADSMAWCYGNGVLTGDGATGKLMPADGATRAQFAKMITVTVSLIG